MPSAPRLVAFVIPAIAGVAAAMNIMAASEWGNTIPSAAMFSIVALSAFTCAAAMTLLNAILRRLLLPRALSDTSRQMFIRTEWLTTLPLLLLFAGALGADFTGPVLVILILLWAIGRIVHFFATLTRDDRGSLLTSNEYLAFLFLISGIAALVYQIVWQRALFSAFGVNVESVTIIVSVFMFGLGIGAIFGGFLSRRYPRQAAQIFLIFELGIGAFGLFSLPLIHLISRHVLHVSLAQMGLVVFVVLCIPTVLMGATLPILVGQLDRQYRSVARSVGLLYCVNTLGSAAACLITADLIFAFAGMCAALLFAAACNFLVGWLVSGYLRRTLMAFTSPIAVVPTT